MNRKEKFNQVEVVKSALIKAGLIDKVTIGAYLMENYVGKKTLHIKCTWDETYKGFSEDRPFYTKENANIEEINNYFSGRVFAAGIVQRKDWLLATPEERKAWMKEHDGDIIKCHPAKYRA